MDLRRAHAGPPKRPGMLLIRTAALRAQRLRAAACARLGWQGPESLPVVVPVRVPGSVPGPAPEQVPEPAPAWVRASVPGQGPETLPESVQV